MKARLQALMQQWHARSRADRRLIAAAGAAVLLGGLYAFLWAPGMEARARLSQSLPRLRAQVEEMRLEQKEIGALRRQLVNAVQGVDLTSALKAAAARRPLSAALDRVEPMSVERAFVTAKAIDFNDWLGWVDSLQLEFGIRLDSCTITASNQPGVVRIEAVFVSPSAAGKLTP